MGQRMEKGQTAGKNEREENRKGGNLQSDLVICPFLDHRLSSQRNLFNLFLQLFIFFVVVEQFL